MKRLREITGELQYLGNIPAVNKHMERIRRTLTETFAQRPPLWELELVRSDLRDLVKFIDREKQKNVYTNFQDTIGEAIEIEGIITRVYEVYSPATKSIISFILLRPSTAMRWQVRQDNICIGTPSFNPRKVLAFARGNKYSHVHEA